MIALFPSAVIVTTALRGLPEVFASTFTLTVLPAVSTVAQRSLDVADGLAVEVTVIALPVVSAALVKKSSLSETTRPLCV